MIARVWHGWTKAEDGDAYAEFLRGTIFPALSARVPGFRGGSVVGGRPRVLVTTLFDSLEAVRAFAGPEYEVPVIEPEAARLLVRGDERASHFEAWSVEA